MEGNQSCKCVTLKIYLRGNSRQNLTKTKSDTCGLKLIKYSFNNFLSRPSGLEIPTFIEDLNLKVSPNIQHFPDHCYKISNLKKTDSETMALATVTISHCYPCTIAHPSLEENHESSILSVNTRHTLAQRQQIFTHLLQKPNHYLSACSEAE